MKYALLLLLTCLSMSACGSTSELLPRALTASGSGAYANELIVAYVDGTSPEDRKLLRQRHGVGSITSVLPGVEVWQLSNPRALADVASSLRTSPSVRFEERNRSRSTAQFSHPWPPAEQGTLDWTGEGAFSNDPRWHLKAARFDEAWKFADGGGITVAVLDSGVDPAHPALRDRLLPTIDELAARGIPDTWNGRSYQGRDGNGHGTHVCGLIGAAADRASGTQGAAPGVKMLPVKVATAEGETDDVTIAKGIVDAVDQGAQVINLSIGGPEPSLVLLEAINYAFSRNVSMVVAAGNEQRGVDFPAAFDGTIAVGATLATGHVASYSNGGEPLVLVAPGGAMQGFDAGPQLLSTLPTYPSVATARQRDAGRYGYMAGTSMATPLVSAAVALLLSREPTLNPAQVRTRLAATAADIGPTGFDPRAGHGALDVARALLEGARP